jgi:hypothetical protein
MTARPPEHDGGGAAEARPSPTSDAHQRWRNGTPGALRAAALDYAERGWAVLPLERGGKRPAGRLVPHGLKEATTDRGIIDRWWVAIPDANIGLATGIAFDVADLDSADADRQLGGLAGGEEPTDGPMVATARGWHCYFSPTGLGNGARLAGIVGFDWRGVGGYVVAPPSVHPSGATYAWMPGLGPETPLQVAPGWLRAIVDPRPPPSPAGLPGGVRPGSRYARTAMDAEVGRLALAPVGQRNHQLNSSAFSLGQLVGAGVLDAETVVGVLVEAALRAGLDEREIEPSLSSGLAAGMAKPRRVAS